MNEPQGIQIRQARPEDAADIAAVNHATWASTYKGILDDAVILSRSLEEQVGLWKQQLGRPSPSEMRFVAEAQGIIVGYAGGGRNPDPHSPFQSELFGIYVLQDYQKKGVGAALTRALAAWLRGQGHRSMLVWILAKNPYRKFYEKFGGSLLEQGRDIDYSGKTLSVVCYGWHDLGKLS